MHPREREEGLVWLAKVCKLKHHLHALLGECTPVTRAKQVDSSHRTVSCSTCSLRIVLFTYHSFFLRKDTGHNQGNHKGEELHVRQNLAFEEVEKVYRKDGMPGRNVERKNKPKIAIPEAIS